MIEITIDCNNDEVIIHDGLKPTVMKVKNIVEVEKVVYEIINAVYQVGTVRLNKLDEDTRTTIEEW